MSANPSADASSVSDLKARVEAERAGRPFLLYRDGSGGQRLFSFEAGCAQATVGRQPPSDLLLDWDDQVSRRHARFERVGEDWELVDDGPSRNGTFVNEKRLGGSCRLNDGDSVRFGTTTILFRSPERAQPRIGGVTETPAAVSLSTSQRRVLTALCRTHGGSSGSAGPATDQQIAEELFLSVGAVRTHLNVLYAKLDVDELPQNEMKLQLVERALLAGLISERDL